MIRLFGLEQIVKYKKKKRRPVALQRMEFVRLQQLILKCQTKHFPQLAFSVDSVALLQSKLTKQNEDRTDALFCALIGYHHWLHRGKKSEVIGDLETGFILLPAETRF